MSDLPEKRREDPGFPKFKNGDSSKTETLFKGAGTWGGIPLNQFRK